jgi:hypothetical protein
VVLRHKPQFLGIGAVCTLAFLGMLVACLILATNERERWGAGAVFGVLLLMSSALLVEGLRRQVTLDDTGIATRGWGGTRRVGWGEVTRLENRHDDKLRGPRFVLRTATGAVNVSHYLDGIDWFVEECRRRLRPEVYGGELEKPITRQMMH